MAADAVRKCVPAGTGESFREMRLRVVFGEWPEELLPIFDSLLDCGVNSMDMLEKLIADATAPDEVEKDDSESDIDDDLEVLREQVEVKSERVAELLVENGHLAAEIKELRESPCAAHSSLLTGLHDRLRQISKLSLGRL